jgi:hypothetical protein
VEETLDSIRNLSHHTEELESLMKEANIREDFSRKMLRVLLAIA